jgi:hypothetical protein
MYIHPTASFLTHEGESLFFSTPQTSGYTPTISPHSMDAQGCGVVGEGVDTLQRPPVAIFIAQARQKQGCRHGTAE